MSLPRADPAAATLTEASGRPEEAGALHLVVMGPRTFSIHELPDRGALTVGRDDQDDVRVQEANASRHHMRLHVHAEAWLEVEDLGSRNGTLVRGRRLAAGQRATVLPGEAISIGWVTVMIQRRRAGTLGAEMGRVHAMARCAAAANINVLILGETGVGKEVLAEEIHRMSPRAGQPLTRVGCAALASGLLESELFGHERAAFTDAGQAKAGLLETAQGGTVLLDEIGELPLALQAKLLRVIEQREVMRVGALRPRSIDVRFLAATNRDLDQEVAQGTFRQDLYYRLNGITLVIPPLRERLQELEPLARRFLERAAQEQGRPVPRLSDAACAQLRAHAWPGNIRELRNMMERALIFCPGDEILPEHLPSPSPACGRGSG